MENEFDQTPAQQPWLQPSGQPAVRPANETGNQPWTQAPAADPRQLEMGKLYKRVKHGRSSLLMLLILSAINMLLSMTQIGTYWPYSISMPYELTYLAKAVENNFSYGSWENGPATYAFVVLGFAVLAVYLVFWILSKKKPGLLMAAAILYTVDSVALLIYVFAVMESALPYLMDFGFHVLALVELYMGMTAARKLKAMQTPEPQVQTYQYHGTCDPEKF